MQIEVVSADAKTLIKILPNIKVSVFAFIDQRPLGNPRHHGAQALAHGFHIVVVAFGAHRLERGLVDAVLEHPVLDELAGLDVVQSLLHRLTAPLSALPGPAASPRGCRAPPPATPRHTRHTPPCCIPSSSCWPFRPHK